MAIKFKRPWLLFAVLCLVGGAYLFYFHSREVYIQYREISSRLELLVFEYRAKRGDVEAQIELADRSVVVDVHVVIGCDTSPEDNQKSLYWYRAAAAQGSGEAVTKLAHLNCDFMEEIKLLEQAAAMGYPRALYDLGQINEGRRDKTKKPDYAAAAEWYRKAVEKGHVGAKASLAMLHHEGKGVEKDDKEAVRLLIEAGAAGDSWAENKLAEFYSEGWGVAQDWKKAYVASNFNRHHDDFYSSLDAKIASNLTKQEIIELDEVIFRKDTAYCLFLKAQSPRDKYRRFGSTRQCNQGKLYPSHSRNLTSATP